MKVPEPDPRPPEVDMLAACQEQALASDTTNYTFEVPPGDGTANIRARLIYRRALRALVDDKGWTQTGNGDPLEDIAPPHYGHLMEIAQDAIPYSVGCQDPADGDMNGVDVFSIEQFAVVGRLSRLASAQSLVS